MSPPTTRDIPPNSPITADVVQQVMDAFPAGQERQDLTQYLNGKEPSAFAAIQLILNDVFLEGKRNWASWLNRFLLSHPLKLTVFGALAVALSMLEIHHFNPHFFANHLVSEPLLALVLAVLLYATYLLGLAVAYQTSILCLEDPAGQHLGILIDAVMNNLRIDGEVVFDLGSRRELKQHGGRPVYEITGYVHQPDGSWLPETFVMVHASEDEMSERARYTGLDDELVSRQYYVNDQGRCLRISRKHGRNLNEWVARFQRRTFTGDDDRTPLRHLIEIQRQAATALAHMHTSGLPHADYNASNVFVSGGEPPGPDTREGDLTEPHAVLGDVINVRVSRSEPGGGLRSLSTNLDLYPPGAYPHFNPAWQREYNTWRQQLVVVVAGGQAQMEANIQGLPRRVASYRAHFFDTHYQEYLGELQNSLRPEPKHDIHAFGMTMLYLTVEHPQFFRGYSTSERWQYLQIALSCLLVESPEDAVDLRPMMTEEQQHSADADHCMVRPCHTADEVAGRLEELGRSMVPA